MLTPGRVGGPTVLLPGTQDRKVKLVHTRECADRAYSSGPRRKAPDSPCAGEETRERGRPAPQSSTQPGRCSRRGAGQSQAWGDPSGAGREAARSERRCDPAHLTFQMAGPAPGCRAGWGSGTSFCPDTGGECTAMVPVLYA